MLFESTTDRQTDKHASFKQIFRSATFWSAFTKKKETIDVPKIRTYDSQIQQCQEMYSRLQLDKQSDFQLPENQFPLLRSYTMITQSRPPTYSPRKKPTHFRPFSIRSAPAFMFDQDDVFDDNVEEVKTDDELNEDKSDNLSDSSELDETGKGRKRCKMDPEKLSDHLQKRGFGLPALVKTAFTYRSCSQKVPKNMRSKSLPKNPSSREKIKGRARLDQEMANMRALAFCEQQAPKVFRSASANMKNRDVQFMEEELKENMQREVMDLNDRDDDDASIVVMPIKQEELFLRIDAWIQDVESASRSHHTHVNLNSSDDIVNQTPVHVT